MYVLENLFEIYWLLCLFASLMFGCSFLISYVMYEKNLISISLHCAIGCYFPFLVFSFDLGFFPFHLYACKGIFQVSRKEEKCIGKYFLSKLTSYSLFSPILHFLLYFLCLSIICWLDVCVIEFILNPLIYMFLCELDARIPIYIYIYIIWYESKLISFQLHCAWRGYFLFSSLHLISVSFPTICRHIWEFFRLLKSKRRKSGNTTHASVIRIPCSFLFRTVHHSSLLY